MTIAVQPLMMKTLTYRSALFDSHSSVIMPPEMPLKSTDKKSWYDFLDTYPITNTTGMENLNTLTFKKFNKNLERNLLPTEPVKKKDSGMKFSSIIWLVAAALLLSLLIALFLNQFSSMQNSKEYKQAPPPATDQTKVNKTGNDNSTLGYGEGSSDTNAETGANTSSGTELNSTEKETSTTGISSETTSSSSDTESNSSVSSTTTNGSSYQGSSDKTSLIMVGAFTERENIDRVVSQLKSQGYEVYTRMPDEWMTYVGVRTTPGDQETLDWVRTNIAPDAWFTK